MKRLMAVFVLAAVISSLLTACGAVEPKVYDDPSQKISVNVGQEFIVELDENPTTGYRWQEEFDNSFLELVEHKYEPASEPKEGKPPMLGAGGTRSFHFKALKKGNVSALIFERTLRILGMSMTDIRVTLTAVNDPKQIIHYNLSDIFQKNIQVEYASSS